jgi:KaiC/GvpD/RAD55 family RecA-like ATPase
MHRLPFGIARLDSIINGGAPPGSVVLLAGEAGAGAREFLYTSAIMNALARADDGLFELNYGQIGEDAVLPEAVHYVSFTESEEELARELSQVIATDVLEASLPHIEFEDLSASYFQLSPVPPSWYLGHSQRLTDLGRSQDRRDTFESLGDYLDGNAEGNLVLIDSLSDLVAAAGGERGWNEVAMLVKGLRRAARGWNGLILLLVDREAVPDHDFGVLMGSADGTFVFEWESGGNELARTMVVKSFRGVLPEIEEEDIVRFETEIHDAGFDISDVRKIR